VFVTSPDLRRALSALGFNDLPKSADTVKQLVMTHAKKMRRVVSDEIQRRKKIGERFSLTFDEWSSARNRRYMIVNVHRRYTFWSLGFERVKGTMPTKECIELLEHKLAEFGFNLTDDIVCICTDGASVMTKVSDSTESEQQLCNTHGIQLAVSDVLYKKNLHVPPVPTYLKRKNTLQITMMTI